MKHRKIYLVSSREPSGATWLINCLLELGVKTYRSSHRGMWRSSSDMSVLNDHEEILKKWLPALHRNSEFKFRNDLEVEWTHVWPKNEQEGCQVIYFVRDPRDSIYSRFKRENPAQTLKEFVQFPDVNTLLDKIENWSLFNKCWLSHPNVKFFRFEDYKQDALATLNSILSFIKLDVPLDSAQLAVKESTFEKAVESEKKYKRAHPEDSDLVNRGGVANEWMVREDSHWLCQEIEERCGDLLDYFGYPGKGRLNKEEISKIHYQTNIRTLTFFQSIIVPESIINEEVESETRDNNIAYLIEFSRNLTPKFVRESKIKEYECRFLINSLKEYYLVNNHLKADGFSAKSILNHIKCIEREIVPNRGQILKVILNKLFSIRGKN